MSTSLPWTPRFQLSCMVIELSLSHFCFSKSNKFHCFAKLYFGNIITLICSHFPIWAEKTDISSCLPKNIIEFIRISKNMLFTNVLFYCLILSWYEPHDIQNRLFLFLWSQYLGWCVSHAKDFINIWFFLLNCFLLNI